MNRFLPRPDLQALVNVLVEAGHDVVGPTIQDGAVVLRSIRHADQLPTGWTDQQAPAVYRLTETGSERQFDFNVGPDSWKKFLFPARTSLAGARLDNDGWHFEPAEVSPPKYAFLGVRACDLAAIAIQDRVFRDGEFQDPLYTKAREQAFIIAVNCSTAAATCFCSSMGTGPRCEQGFDLALTELDDGFLVQVGSEIGKSVLDKIATILASQSQQQAADKQIDRTEQAIEKQFQSDGVRELLLENLEHTQWDAVAERCLSCTNCTMVCPTCFCSDVEEVPSLDETEVQRVRQWDSCFNHEMSYMASETARPNIRSRYRQWLTHKLSTWHDQFDTSGCVGCGRCVTWCPVGIDLTETVNAIRDEPEQTSLKT